MNQRQVLIFLFLVFSILAAVPFAQAETQGETLKQYISDLQSNPNDNSLREKIIKIVQTMKPAPAVPDEAKKHMARGMAAFESAKNEQEYKDAISEFEKAVSYAPWLGEGYRNLGIVQDKANQFDAAIKSLKLYLLTNPSDAEKAKELIYKIEFRKEKAAKESSPEVIAEKKKKDEEEFIKKLNGARYVWLFTDRWSTSRHVLDIEGNKIIHLMRMECPSVGECNETTLMNRDWKKQAEGILQGHTFKIVYPYSCPNSNQPRIEEGIISDNGNSITIPYCGEPWRTFRRER